MWVWESEWKAYKLTNNGSGYIHLQVELVFSFFADSTQKQRGTPGRKPLAESLLARVTEEKQRNKDSECRYFFFSSVLYIFSSVFREGCAAIW